MLEARLRDVAERSVEALEAAGERGARRFRRSLDEAEGAEDLEVLLCNLEMAVEALGDRALERDLGRVLSEFEAAAAAGDL